MRKRIYQIGFLALLFIEIVFFSFEVTTQRKTSNLQQGLIKEKYEQIHNLTDRNIHLKNENEILKDKLADAKQKEKTAQLNEDMYKQELSKTLFNLHH